MIWRLVFTDWLHGDCFQTFIVALVVWTWQVVDIIEVTVSLSLSSLHRTFPSRGAWLLCHRCVSRRYRRPLFLQPSSLAILLEISRSWNNSLASNNDLLRRSLILTTISQRLRHLDWFSSCYDVFYCYETGTISEVTAWTRLIVYEIWCFEFDVLKFR